MIASLCHGRVSKESSADVGDHWPWQRQSLTRLSFGGQGIEIPGPTRTTIPTTHTISLSFLPPTHISSFLSCENLVSTDRALRTTSGRCQRRRGPLHSQGASGEVSTSHSPTQCSQPRGSGDICQSMLPLLGPKFLHQGRALIAGVLRSRTIFCNFRTARSPTA